MDLTHRFTVPVPIDEAWAHFNDIGSVAECFPGASVTSAEGDTFAGSVKVKLGPIALVYNGTGTFTEKDEATHRMVVDAKGKDKRGNGTAGAAVVMTMTEAGTSTDIEVVTDLAITGKPAQFGRGVMQDVSDKLLGQFVACLEQRFDGAGGAEADVPEAAAVAEVPEVPAAPVPPAAEPDPTLTDEAAPAAVEVPPPATAAAAAPAPAPAPATVAGKRKKDDDVLNLGATVLPVLAKSYWKQALGALVGVAIIVWVVTRL
jgi:carbon monoxide dehydrogenase subunit G